MTNLCYVYFSIQPKWNMYYGLVKNFIFKNLCAIIRIVNWSKTGGVCMHAMKDKLELAKLEIGKIIKDLNSSTACFTGHRSQKLPWRFNEKMMKDALLCEIHLL